MDFTDPSDARSRGASVDVVPGDARLRLREAAQASYRVLVLGAFGSDAVPVRLLTLEAIRLHLAKLDHHGLLVFNPASYLVLGGRQSAPPSHR